MKSLMLASVLMVSSPISDFDLICSAVDGDVLVNTNSFAVGIRTTNDANKVILMETNLVEYVNDCDHCYDVTISSPVKSGLIYLLHLRTEPSKPYSRDSSTLAYSISIDKILENGSHEAYFPKINCIPNPAYGQSSHKY